MERQAFEHWIEGYIHTWKTNDPRDIGRLFASDARYYTGPFDTPWQGRDAIVAGWIERQDDFNMINFRYKILAVNDDLGIVRGWTIYKDDPPREYSNIWLIRLDDAGRCTEFTEWWVERR